MTRVRKARTRPTPPVPFTVTETFTPEGRAPLSPGTELSVRGERGRFKFIHHCTNDRTGEGWITVWGPLSGDGQRAQWRSFDPARVRTVHRLRKTRQ